MATQLHFQMYESIRPGSSRLKRQKPTIQSSSRYPREFKSLIKGMPPSGPKRRSNHRSSSYSKAKPQSAKSKLSSSSKHSRRGKSAKKAGFSFVTDRRVKKSQLKKSSFKKTTKFLVAKTYKPKSAQGKSFSQYVSGLYEGKREAKKGRKAKRDKKVKTVFQRRRISLNNQLDEVNLASATG